MGLINWIDNVVLWLTDSGRRREGWTSVWAGVTLQPQQPVTCWASTRPTMPSDLAGDKLWAGGSWEYLRSVWNNETSSCHISVFLVSVSIHIRNSHLSDPRRRRPLSEVVLQHQPKVFKVSISLCHPHQYTVTVDGLSISQDFPESVREDLNKAPLLFNCFLRRVFWFVNCCEVLHKHYCIDDAFVVYVYIYL